MSTSHANQLTVLLSDLITDVHQLQKNKGDQQERAVNCLGTISLLETMQGTSTKKDNVLEQRIVTLETELAGSIAARDQAVTAQYSLESRLTQALKDCQGLSTSSASMRSEQRSQQEKQRVLEVQVSKLEQQLANSVPAAKVQSILEAAAQRVSGICDGAQKSQQELEKAKRKILKLQCVVENIPKVVEEKTAEEIRQRRRSDMLAKEATLRANKLERKLIELETSTKQLRNMLKSAQEGIGVMKTIARIRNTDVDGKGGSGGGSIGFDAVANTIDGVSRQVDARVHMKKKMNRNGNDGKIRRRKKKDVFANMVNGV